MKREELEQEALKAVCACWYYDLADSLDSVDNMTLYKIIDYPKYTHIQEQIHNPIALKEFVKELEECRG